MQTILIVDDDPQIRAVLAVAFERAGFATTWAGDGAAALAAAAAGPDLIVLDIGLPERDGLEVCRRLRQIGDVPILFLTARDDEVDRVLGLELGGDDYVTKPFSPRELVARVKAILKRGRRAAGLVRGMLGLDPGAHVCTVAGGTVALTATELRLLARLMQAPGQVLSRGQLADTLYGSSPQGSERTVDSHLRNLRAKLAAAGCPDAIETLHGIGVRMGPCRGG